MAYQDLEYIMFRIGELAKLMADAGLIVLSAFISPHKAERELVRNLLPDGEFLEVYVNTPIEVCEQRDPKGLYVKARAGEIKGFTGIDDPYEAPTSPEMVVKTGELSPEQAAAEIIKLLEVRGLLDA